MFISMNFYQQQELMKKDMLIEILFLKKKDKKHQKKNLINKTNTSNAKNGYNLDYEIGNIEEFIDQFKNKKNKRIRKRNKRNEK